MTYKKKLIEVALPLDAINAESAREKSIRHGHPSTLHLWWARRPLAACRAVLFAQMVDDPSAHPDEFPTEEAQQQERERLFRIIEELVKWENINNETVLEAARAEIRRCAPPEGLPPVLDPFAGGGSIPLEAQRLGLEAHASDLNPVAVLINKALIEIPPKFAGQPPVNPAARKKIGSQSMWKGAAGLAEDVRYYGQWMRDEAEQRIGHLYPKVRLPEGGQATVIAWLWARTVQCPNPACGAQMPLISSYWLSPKKGKAAWVEPVVDRSQRPPKIRFEVRTGRGQPGDPPKVGRGAKFRCLACGQVAQDQHIKDEGMAGRMGAKLMAIVAEGDRGRIYIAPNAEHERIAEQARPQWAPTESLPYEPRAIWCTLYGLTTFKDLFTDRQLVALTTFSDLVQEARARVLADAQDAGLPADRASAYADAVATYLAFAVDKATDYWTTIATWMPRGTVGHAFARQAIPITWDFPEANPFAKFHCAWDETYEWVSKSIVELPRHPRQAFSKQADAAKLDLSNRRYVVSTDPPYYDNIGYADLSDYFYVWLRCSLQDVHPELFNTLLVPKAQELVASPYRFDGDRERARDFFETGLRQTFANLHRANHPQYPLTVYYAFKQSETDEDDTNLGANGGAVVSTGWETMLDGLIDAGFQITGTWPMRTERGARSVSLGTNALASSIVLVCRQRSVDAGIATRRDFLNALQRELPAALHKLQQGNIAPVDLAQASIGPGMAIFSRYSKVVEADGSPMSVRTALALINQALDEYLTEQEGDYDRDTRWALAWYEQHGFDEGLYGQAETLSTAKNTSVQGMVEAGFLYARGGKVRLLRRDELNPDWNPAQDTRLTVWELAQHLIHALETQGVDGAARLLAAAGPRGDVGRELAYRLYTLCERKGWAQEALAYNGLVVAWSDIRRRAAELAAASPVQERLL